MENEPYIVELIKRFYHFHISSYVSEISGAVIKVRTSIIFTPKEFRPVSPNSIKFIGIWYYYPDIEKYDLYDLTYIRGCEMPILKYTQEEYEFDNYLEKISFKEYEKVLHEKLNNHLYDIKGERGIKL